MSILKEIGKLLRADPRGWKAEYYDSGDLKSLAYKNTYVFFTRPYQRVHCEVEKITVYPGGTDLGRWGRWRMMRLVEQWAAEVAKSHTAQLESDKYAKEMAEVDKLLEADLNEQFRPLLEAARSDQEKLKAAPVISGLAKGLSKGWTTSKVTVKQKDN